MRGLLGRLIGGGVRSPGSKSAKCDICGAVSQFAMEDKTVEVALDDDRVEDVEFKLIRMQGCGHATVVLCFDRRARATHEKLRALRARRKLLVGSGDLSGVTRIDKKKMPAAQRIFREATRRAWAEHGHLVEEPAAPVLTGE